MNAPVTKCSAPTAIFGYDYYRNANHPNVNPGNFQGIFGVIDSDYSAKMPTYTLPNHFPYESILHLLPRDRRTRYR